MTVVPDVAVGPVIWLTGLPASGKSWLAQALVRAMTREGRRPLLLDSDRLRPILAPDSGYGEQARAEFYRRLSALAALLARQGAAVIIAATAARRAYREDLRRQVPDLVEVYVRCPLSVCRARDPKGLYARADAGEIKNLPGVGVVYEPPLHPAVVVDTSLLSADAAAQRVLRHLATRLPLPAPG